MSLQFVSSPASALGGSTLLLWDSRDQRDKTFLSFPLDALGDRLRLRLTVAKWGVVLGPFPVSIGYPVVPASPLGSSRGPSLTASSRFLGATWGEIALWAPFINLTQLWKRGSLYVWGSLV